MEQTGNLLIDAQSAIDNSVVLHINYIDKKGVGSSRDIAPFEIRDQYLWAWSMEKNALRMFLLSNIESYQITEQTFDKAQFH